MKKLFIIPILFAFAFSQNKSNQTLYAIETTTANYNNVSIESVYGLDLMLYDRELNDKLNIPIAEIKTLRQNGWKTNDLATFIFTIAGGASGVFAAWVANIAFHSSGDSIKALVSISTLGGSVMLGYKLGKNIFKRRYKVIEFEGLTLDKKINYLMSIVNK